MVGFVCNISLMSNSSFHDGDKDGDQNNDLPYDQLFDNVDIFDILLLSHLFQCYLVKKSSIDELDWF